jgi:2-oxoglutarate dehydrogenase complex dehydrogenase (E1) component-like enzyme
VHASWNAYFSGSNYEEPPTLGKATNSGQLDEILSLLKSGAGASAATPGTRGVGGDRAAKEAVQLAALLNAFETVGHLVAETDPLEL